ncbi:hypothetical protein HanPSC8_Chr16g0746711 [Helianthus annuus]|nr:hypothetical protein HanPSC8_Chr16g0746711 [Helianthus annuus]
MNITMEKGEMYITNLMWFIYFRLSILNTPRYIYIQGRVNITLFYLFRENNVKSGGRLIMHQVVALIDERQKGTCTNRPLSRLLSVMCLMSKA